MRSVYDAIKSVFTLRPQTATSTQTGAAIDTLGYNSASVALEVGAVNCFPSGHDAKALWLETGRHAKTNSLALIGYPFAAIIWIADKLRIIWFDLIYAAILYGLVKVII